MCVRDAKNSQFDSPVAAATDARTLSTKLIDTRGGK